MTITRINHFVAKEELENTLHAFLQSVISVILECPGCISCEILRSVESPAQLAIIEKWESIAAHQEAAKAIPQEKLAEVMALLASPPSGSYYTT